MKRKSIVLLSFLLVSTLVLSACSALSDAAELTEYDFGTDKVPSVNAVIGAERKVTGVSTGTSNGTQYKEYTYETASMQEDLGTYLNYLMEAGWIPINDFNTNDGVGEAQLAIESLDAGKVLAVTVAFEASSYTVRVQKGDGTLTRN